MKLEVQIQYILTKNLRIEEIYDIKNGLFIFGYQLSLENLLLSILINLNLSNIIYDYLFNLIIFLEKEKVLVINYDSYPSNLN